MARKAQVVALIDADLRTSIDALRIITKDSRARVMEDLLREAVAAHLGSPAVNKDIKRIHRLARQAGVSFAEYVSAYAQHFARDTYGPGLDALEAGAVTVTVPEA